MTGTGRRGSIKRGRNAAARPGNQRGVVTGELAIKREEEKESSSSKSSQEKTDGRKNSKNSEYWFQVCSSSMPSVLVTPERRSECTH